MKRNRLVFILVLLFLAVLVLLWSKISIFTQLKKDSSSFNELEKKSLWIERQNISQQPAFSVGNQSSIVPEEAEKQEQEKRRSLIAEIGSMLNTSITFYGKVVDQNGNLIPHANVEYGLLDNFNASGSVGKTVADGNGFISISGVRGAVISVSVYKEGYYHIHNVSNQSFGYGYGPDTYVKSPPTKDNPAVFVLHKRGEAESLIVVEKRFFHISKDGVPVRVDLSTGRVSSTGQLQVQTWTNDQFPNEQKRYDWKARVSVPGGGLIERDGKFEFEAPSEGYRKFDEIVMIKNDPKWNKRFEKDYFLQFNDSSYARVSFSFTSAGEHYFRIESYFNPTPGSRNLEYDPSKRIDP